MQTYKTAPGPHLTCPFQNAQAQQFYARNFVGNDVESAQLFAGFLVRMIQHLKPSATAGASAKSASTDVVIHRSSRPGSSSSSAASTKCTGGGGSSSSSVVGSSVATPRVEAGAGDGSVSITFPGEDEQVQEGADHWKINFEHFEDGGSSSSSAPAVPARPRGPSVRKTFEAVFAPHLRSSLLPADDSEHHVPAQKIRRVSPAHQHHHHQITLSDSSLQNLPLRKINATKSGECCDRRDSMSVVSSGSDSAQMRDIGSHSKSSVASGGASSGNDEIDIEQGSCRGMNERYKNDRLGKIDLTGVVADDPGFSTTSGPSSARSGGESSSGTMEWMPPARRERWMLEMIQRCCFSPTSLVAGSIYLSRLTEGVSGRKTGMGAGPKQDEAVERDLEAGDPRSSTFRDLSRASSNKAVPGARTSLFRAVEFTENSWQTVWCCLMIIAEKYWEDNYIHPGHVVQTFGLQCDKRTILRMQIWLLDALDWTLGIPLPEYQDALYALRVEGAQSGLPFACPKIFIERPIPNKRSEPEPDPPTRMPLPPAQAHAQHQQINPNFAFTAPQFPRMKPKHQQPQQAHMNGNPLVPAHAIAGVGVQVQRVVERSAAGPIPAPQQTHPGSLLDAFFANPPNAPPLSGPQPGRGAPPFPASNGPSSSGYNQNHAPFPPTHVPNQHMPRGGTGGAHPGNFHHPYFRAPGGPDSTSSTVFFPQQQQQHDHQHQQHYILHQPQPHPQHPLGVEYNSHSWIHGGHAPHHSRQVHQHHPQFHHPAPNGSTAHHQGRPVPPFAMTASWQQHPQQNQDAGRGGGDGGYFR
mmetsp:Transcript_12363/g.29976  ORF Transcript_12363/g.29976 Transcript_12363/m.29976 type:complete len:807 (-) Transcript_12363:48-2468(-)|eukprot:CAMPEP_0178986308 /NCGR_PEP_ID=MMETSP0795-20121207/2635_1 /TAXON_ID=88552 /ORGANISM="Amoebophrya sp., Strain Ameob2" /LENGTH=806 /DNA_ID=CAMNT_0020677361 /DNA_START=159 /DNA_END=2579 /DNA_ORIENTATION=-